MARILVVDDYPIMRQLVARVLGRAGHDVLQAINGEDGAAVLRSTAIDLAILDVHMPGMGGLELLALIRSSSPGVPVMVMTGGADVETLKHAGGATWLGAAAVLAKPFKHDELLELDHHVLDGRARPDTAAG